MKFRKDGRIREHTVWDLGEGLDWNLGAAIPSLELSLALDTPYLLANSGDVPPGDWRVLSGDYPLTTFDDGPGALFRMGFDISTALHGQFLGLSGDTVDWYFPSGEGFSISGAPVDAAFIVAQLNTAMTNERQLDGRKLIKAVDDPGNSKFWIEIDTDGAMSGDAIRFDGTEPVWSGDGPGGGLTDPIVLEDRVTPSVEADSVVVYGQVRAGAQVVPWARPNIGEPYTFLPMPNKKRIMYLVPTNASLANGTFGMSAGNTDGTQTFITGGSADNALTTTTLPYTPMARLHLSSSASNAGVGWRAQDLTFWRGSAARHGGFYLYWRLGTITIPSGYRTMVACTSHNTGLVSDPSGLNATMLGAFVKDAADTNVHFQTKAGAAAATRTNLGFAFVATGVYDFELFCEPNGSTIYYRVYRWDTDAEMATGSADISGISNSTFCRAYSELGTPAAGGSTVLALMQFYGERDS